MHEGETVLTDASKRQMRTTDYRKDYKLARTLGQGSFAKVKIGTCHADGTKWAVKIIDRRNLSKDDADALGIEVETMLRVRHPNIVELMTKVQTQTQAAQWGQQRPPASQPLKQDEDDDDGDEDL